MWYTIESSDDWLSKIALKYLGDAQKWPVIYDMNKDVIGTNPNIVRPGMTIWVPIDGAQKPSQTQQTTPTSTVSNGPSDPGFAKAATVGLAVVLAALSFFLIRKK